MKIGIGAGVGAVITGLSVWGMDKLGWIDRWAFDWQSFSTLATGGAAVIGAIWIGSRQSAITLQQTAIAHRQADIMAMQTQIQRATLSGEFYDRRITILRNVRNYYALSHNSDEQITAIDTDELTIAMLDAAESAAFLFNNDASEVAWELYEIVHGLLGIYQEHQNALANGIIAVFPVGKIADAKGKADTTFRRFVKITKPYLRMGLSPAPVELDA